MINDTVLLLIDERENAADNRVAQRILLESRVPYTIVPATDLYCTGPWLWNGLRMLYGIESIATYALERKVSRPRQGRYYHAPKIRTRLRHPKAYQGIVQ